MTQHACLWQSCRYVCSPVYASDYRWQTYFFSQSSAAWHACYIKVPCWHGAVWHVAAVKPDKQGCQPCCMLLLVLVSDCCCCRCCCAHRLSCLGWWLARWWSACLRGRPAAPAAATRRPSRAAPTPLRAPGRCSAWAAAASPSWTGTTCGAGARAAAAGRQACAASASTASAQQQQQQQGACSAGQGSRSASGCSCS